MAIERLPATGDAPRHTGVPASLVPGGAADSAGFPWAGRTFDHHETAFAGDDGSTPTEWRDAVVAVRNAVRATAGVATAGDYWDRVRDLADTHAAAIQTLSRIRLLIPLLAEAGDVGLTPEGRTVEKTQELSIVTVTGPDGRPVMPAFSSVDAMRSWNPEARPIPVPAPQAALAASQEGTDLIMIDPGSAEREFGVRRTQLEALALGQWVLPAWADPAVAAAFRDSLPEDPRVQAVDLSPGDPEARLLAAETVVNLRLGPGIDRAGLDELISVIQASWAAHEVIAARVDSLRLVLRSAGQ